MVPVEEINNERLDRWKKFLKDNQATAVLLVAIGHDERSGQTTICTTESMSDNAILLFLQAAIAKIAERN